jgi:hypothetical protein
MRQPPSQGLKEIWDLGGGSATRAAARSRNSASALIRLSLTRWQKSLDKPNRSAALNRREMPVTKVVTTTAKHPVRPCKGRIDVAAAHARVAARFPKTLAKLAE